MIAEIRDYPFRSMPLANLPLVGDLSDCRKKYFGNAQYRVVYRLLPNAVKPSEADVIAVGARIALAVYKIAAARLSR